MNITITPTPLCGKIQCIESKSHVHRLLIAAAFGNKTIHITCAESSEDIDATARCLNALGANVCRTETGFSVSPFSKITDTAYLDCGESGSTLRFLLPVIGALGVTAEISLSGRLPNRPLSPLWEELESHGMSLSKTEDGKIRCRGKLQAGNYTLSGNISSQFISGLLFALPFLDGNSVLSVTGTMESQNYIAMTVDTLNGFSINFDQQGQTFYIQGNQQAHTTSVTAEGDWSNAAFWLVASALSGPISCLGLNIDSLQGDRNILDLLQQFNAKIIINDDICTVEKRDLNAIWIDAKQIPDLVPILAVCATQATGMTTIFNAERLRIKESDRLMTVCETLTTLGADIVETADGLIIKGDALLKGGVTIDSHNDHRIAMSAAVASICCQEPITITNAQAVNKSYPKFWEHFERLGGKITRSDTNE